MKYKLFYIDDALEDDASKDKCESKPNSRVEELKKYFDVIASPPDNNIKNIIEKIMNDNYDIILMDYYFTEKKSYIYNAPTLASTLRNISTKEVPIILISTEDKVKHFNKKDFVNHDLFDFCEAKHIISDSTEDFNLFSNHITSFVKAYKKIEDVIIKSKTLEKGMYIYDILSINPETIDLPTSFLVKVSFSERENKVYEVSRFIYKYIIKSIGILIGEDVLAARLGVDKNKSTEQWKIILDQLENCKYKGIFNDIETRWWAHLIEEWWDNNFPRVNLRSANAKERVNLLNLKFQKQYNLSLTAAEPTLFSKTTNFWTICQGDKSPIEIFDGVPIITKEYKDWQEPEYYSKKFLSEHIGKESIFNNISPIDKKNIIEMLNLYETKKNSK